MRQLLLIAFFISSAHFLEAQSQVKFPDIIISEIKNEITIETSADSVWFSMGNQQRWLAATDGLATLTLVPEGGERITFELDQQTYVAPSKTLSIWWSILPPLLAILMAFVTKEVISSLLGGIFIGVAVISYHATGFIGILESFFLIVTDYLLPALADADHVSIIMFTGLIGATVAVISQNGGVQGLVSYISKYAKNRQSGQMATYLLGLSIFFDDIANTLVVGNAMRPVTDRLKISREKLSYLVDSTAAPLAAIAFITVWIGAELDYIASGLEVINRDSEKIALSPYQILLGSLPYSFYPILTLLFMFVLILKQKDYGPMLHFERQAQGPDYLSGQEVREVENNSNQPAASQPSGNIWFAVIPLVSLILGTIVSIGITGYDGAVWRTQSGIEKITTVVGHSDPFKGLLWSSFLSLVIALVMSVFTKRLPLSKGIEVAISGIKDVLTVLVILLLAWSLSAVSGQMRTAELVTLVIGDTISPYLIPAITFVIAAIIAFGTGTSWGTMAILYPLVLPASYTVAIQNGIAPELVLDLFMICVASVLAGAVLGDHCSPISDTTILSSLSSSCNHINHVKTQIPYALTVGGVAIVFGILPASFGVSSWITLPLATLILILIISKFGKRVELPH